VAEQKIQITDGQTTSVVTTSEYAALVANRPDYMPPLTVVGDAPLDAVYENADGELAREGISAEQFARRAGLGQQVAATPERVELQRAQEVRRTVEATADDSDFTALVNSALPGAQFMQNLAVGKDQAAEARQQLNTNFLVNLTGNLAEFAIGGKAIGLGFKGLLGAERAAKLGTKLGLGTEASALARAGRVAAADAAVETHFYTQNLLDRADGEFVAEDWASQVGVGLLLGGPFILGAGARGVGASVRRGIDAVSGGLPGAMSVAGDILTTANILKPGGMKARYASAAHVSGRVWRRAMGKRRGSALGVTDEAALRRNKILDDMDTVGAMVPDSLDRMRPSKRRALIEDFKAVADGNVDFLDEIGWGTITKRTSEMGRKVNGIRSQMLGVHRRFKGDGVEIKMSNRARDAALSEANILMQYVDEAGMAEVKGAIQRGILDGGADPAAMHRAFMEAKINARFRRGVSGGADVVDDAISRFMADDTIWGKAQAKKNRAILAAIDDTVAVWDELGATNITKLTSDGKLLEDIELNDALHLQGTQGAVSRIRANMETMETAGLLSRDQVRGIETKLVDADQALLDGVQAYGDVIKINRARKQAAGRLSKDAEVNHDIPTSPESFAANKAAMVAETAKDLLELGNTGLDALLSTKPMELAARGVGALHGMSTMDKYEVFYEIQKELPTLTGNPEYAMSKLSSLLDRGAAYDPVGADQAGSKMVNTMYWLASQMPKPDDTIYGRHAPEPLSLVEEYLEKHVAAYDPLSVGLAVFSGRVTPGMIDAVRVTAPAMYAEMNSIFAEVLSKVPADKANPKVVTSIGMFMGGLDPMYTGNFIMQLQSTYAQTTTQDGVINGGVNNIPNRNQPGSANSQLTTSQRQQTY